MPVRVGSTAPTPATPNYEMLHTKINHTTDHHGGIQGRLLRLDVTRNCGHGVPDRGGNPPTVYCNYDSCQH